VRSKPEQAHYILNFMFMRYSSAGTCETLTMISAGKSGPIQRVDHGREAVRLRRLAKTATTGQIKARLLEQARQHELLASFEAEASADPAGPPSASSGSPV
jgi:hypothetical protein